MLQHHQVKAAAHLLLCISTINFLALSLQAAGRPLALIKTPVDQETLILPNEEGYGLETASFDGSLHRSPISPIQMVTRKPSFEGPASKHPATPSWNSQIRPKYHLGWLHHNMLDSATPSSGSDRHELYTIITISGDRTAGFGSKSSIFPMLPKTAPVPPSSPDPTHN